MRSAVTRIMNPSAWERRALAGCAALLLLVTGAAGAQQCSNCGRSPASDSLARRTRVLPAFGLRFGEPQKLSAAIGIVDVSSSEPGSFQSLATTAAWNLQQGAMLHWLEQPEPLAGVGS